MSKRQHIWSCYIAIENES